MLSKKELTRSLDGELRLCLLGLCPTRAEGESTTSGSKPYRYGLLSHDASVTASASG
jgi:hypothetical protein